MSDSTGTLWGILQGDGPVGVVFYSSPSDRESLIELCHLLAPTNRPIERTKAVEAAFQDLDALLLITPDDEHRAVLMLDGRREALRDRTAPALLFLLRDGDGERELRASAAALESWLRGNEYDTDNPGRIDRDARLKDFEAEAGCSPVEFLAAWRHGEIQDTAQNNVLAHRAALLERSE
jgi:hypothetical protein